MPKTIYKIDKFHGGINNSADARDISDMELAECVGLEIDDIGRIKAAPRFELFTIGAEAIEEGKMAPGYGLFTFSSDYSNAEEGPDEGVPEKKSSDYVVFSSGNQNSFSILRRSSDHNDETITSPVSVVSGIVEGGPIAATGMFKKVKFSLVNGALRIYDTEFENKSRVFWYGVVNRKLFNGLAGEHNKWGLTFAHPEAPSEGWIKNDATLSTPTGEFLGSGYTNNTSWDDTTLTLTKYITKTALHDKFDDSANGNEHLFQFVTFLSFTINQPDWYLVGGLYVTLTLKQGPYNNATGSWIGTPIEENLINKEFMSNGTHTPTFNRPTVYLDTNANWGGGSDDQYRLEFIFELDAAVAASFSASSYVSYIEQASTAWNLNVGGELANDRAISSNNAVLLLDWEDGVKEGAGWDNADNSKKWEIGVSYTYDNSQESSITRMALDSNAVGTARRIIEPTTTGGTDTGVDMELLIMKPNGVDAAGNITDEANAINPRITDINLYFKDITGQDTSDHVGLGSLGEWFLLGTGSYITGKFKIISSGREIEAFPIFHNSSSVHDLMSWSIMAPDVGDAPNIVSYEANAGLASGTTSTEAIYKTSVVANGRLYAGNIELVEGNGKRTRMADALVRSPISAFDILPNTDIVEASANDGDEIIKLEEYADRILQFKRNKLQIINIAQDLEFLEDTYNYKGIPHPEAVCRTDYGIAWINKYGCFLYDGKQVVDLLEREKQRIISAKEWSKFYTDPFLASPFEEADFSSEIGGSIISYIASKKQLIILKDTAAYRPLTGNITNSGSDAIISGEGTSFTTEVEPDSVNGSVISYIGTNGSQVIRKVISVQNDRRMTLNASPLAITGGRAYVFNTADIMIYDLLLGSWVKAKNKLPSGTAMWGDTSGSGPNTLGQFFPASFSNFAINKDGNPIIVSAELDTPIGSSEGSDYIYYDEEGNDLSHSDFSWKLPQQIWEWDKVLKGGVQEELGVTEHYDWNFRPFLFKTKDIDFGNLSQKKKVYKLAITHKGKYIDSGGSATADTNVAVSYSIDGSDSYTVIGTDLRNQDNWTTTEIDLPSPITCYSFQIKFENSSGTGLVPHNFEVNDIAITFRPLGIR